MYSHHSIEIRFATQQILVKTLLQSNICIGKSHEGFYSSCDDYIFCRLQRERSIATQAFLLRKESPLWAFPESQNTKQGFENHHIWQIRIFQSR